MARRKKTEMVSVAPAAPVVLEEAPPAVAPEEYSPLKLSEVECLTLKLAETEALRYTAEANLRVIQREALLRKIDPEGQLAKLDADLRTCAERTQAARRKYAASIQGIENRLKLKLADYSFDDETGVLVPH